MSLKGTGTETKPGTETETKRQKQRQKRQSDEFVQIVLGVAYLIGP